MFYAAKQLFGDFVTAIVFIVVYAATDNLPLAIGATIVVAFGQIGVAYFQKRRLDLMVWLSLFLVIAFGTAALISNDPRFVMVKPSLIHLSIGIVMLRRGWMLRYIEGEKRQYIPDSVIIASGYGWAAFMIVLAIANVAVALTASFATWAWFVSVGLLGAKVLAFGVQYAVFRTAAMRQVRLKTNGTAVAS